MLLITNKQTTMTNTHNTQNDLVMISSQYNFVSYGRYKLTSCIGFNGEYMDFSCTTTDTEFIDAIKSGDVPDYEKKIFDIVVYENESELAEWVMSVNEDNNDN